MLVIAVCIVQANCRQWVVLCMHVALIATQKLAESSGSEDNSDVSAFCNDCTCLILHQPALKINTHSMA